MAEPVGYDVDGKLIFQKREEVRMTRTDADVCVCAFVAASSVCDGNEW